MPTPANLVHQTAISTGTGNFALNKVNGKNDFATAFTTGGTNVFDYFISNRDAAEWERGTGHMDTTGDLVRDDVLETHAGTTSKVDFSVGTKDVTNDIPALTQVRGTTAGSSGFVPTLATTAGNLLQPSGLLATTAAIYPATNDGVTLGTSANKFADLYLASGGVLQFSTEATNITHAASQLTIAASSLNINTSQLTVNAVTADIGSVRFTTSSVRPATNDGVSLGTSANKFSDLYLASGGVLQFSTEATNITHAASQLTIAASSLNINTSQLTVTAVTADIGSVRFTTSTIVPATNDGVALGTTALKFSDLRLANGGVVSFSTLANATISHTTNNLRIGQGLLFNNDTADANSLDDYEEGTFDPILRTNGTDFTSVTYDGVRSGRYTKTGNVVTISIFMRTDSVTVGSASGNVNIGGLPFACLGQAGFAVGEVGGWAGEDPGWAMVFTGESVVFLYFRATVDGPASFTQVADVGTGADANTITLSGNYIAS